MTFCTVCGKEMFGRDQPTACDPCWLNEKMNPKEILLSDLVIKNGYAEGGRIIGIKEARKSINSLWHRWMEDGTHEVSGDQGKTWVETNQ